MRTYLILMGGVLLLACVIAVPLVASSSRPFSPEVRDSVRDYSGTLPVFPGAEGFGIDTPAGRGGRVILVTTLDSDGPGSLREALSASGPRTVLFEVGGIVRVREPLVIAEPFVTVAGQTAPSPGITIAGAGVDIATHDVLLQHLRIRVGDEPNGQRGDGRDGITIDGAPDGSRQASHIVIDHCSISWAIDEGIGTWNPGVSDVTVRQCIIAENLSHSLHPKGEHSKGMLIGDHSMRIAVIGNLFADNMQRNPFAKGNTSVLIANNLIYNPGTCAIHFGDADNHGPSLGTVVGNAFVPGPDTRRYVPLVSLLLDMDSATQIYGFDNALGGQAEARSYRTWGVWHTVKDYAACAVRATPLTLRPSSETSAWVLASAGARPTDRDTVDIRILDGVTHGTGRIIDSPSQVGGLPHVAETRRSLALPASPSNDDDHNGYTNIEAWLHALAREVE